MKNKTCIIIPAYNEEKNLPKVLKSIGKKYTVVVIDDGSVDNTKYVKHDKNVYMLSFRINLGKSEAISIGCKFAIEYLNMDNVIFMDADMQHRPCDIKKFENKLKVNDVVIGIRKDPTIMPITLKIGNYLIAKFNKILFNIDLEDATCGFRAMTSRAYQNFSKDIIENHGYNFEVDMNVWIAENNIKFDIVKVPTIYNDKYKGTGVSDGVKMVFRLIVLKIKYNIYKQ